MSACQKCGAPLVWGTTERGKAVPLDPPMVEVVPIVHKATVVQSGRGYGKTAAMAGRVTVVCEDGVTVSGVLADSDLGRQVLADSRAAGLEVEPVVGRVSHFASCPHAASFRRAR